MCNNRRKCLDCGKLLRGIREIQEHVCGRACCPSCRQDVMIHKHRCFVQVAKTPDQLRAEKRQKRRRDDQDYDDEDTLPLHVVFDIESMQEGGCHVPNLVVA